MVIDNILSRLDGVKKTGRASFMAKCPSHADRSPSLTIREAEDGRVLLHCFAGCAAYDVLAAVGLEFTDLYPRNPIERGPRFRRPFPAADVLEALAEESLIVQMIGKHVLEEDALNPEQYARLRDAVERIHRGRDLANG